MKKEDAKELLPIIQAYAEGKEIEFCDLHGIWSIPEELSFSSKPKNYRIKREPKYRPFDNCDELIQFWEKHYDNSNRPKGTMPLIWVKSGENPSLISSFDFTDDEVLIDKDWFELTDLFKVFTFLDGTPCGMVTE